MTTSVRTRLSGSWRMTDWKVFCGEEELDPPLGPAADCAGLLIYTDEGTMSANLTLLERPPFADGSLDGGTQQERADAYRSVIAYAGTYDVDELTEAVVHHVEIATFPNFVGTDLTRTCIFEDENTLKLDTPPMKMGGEWLGSYIRWQRTGTEGR
ncbi:lipocalin-like domain-containing protein [Streptomyces sp. 110]|uniref:Lipocalin-like domain-containing protein n=1 Tax=Streptomyces endocoffeicus TaxID=2898945 RepID=A0ABS1Q480_9ACTN|nr:lipocalin-like domain-containing protein [Streptomyces endocoffeicus]MBL1119479.1 lipocalin-like domain-containing protein [Streptomyces endocoffeicus]